MTEINTDNHETSPNGFSKRTRVAVMFGGRSVEHEISVITGLQIIRTMDVIRFEPVPVYIAPSGRWYSGQKLLDKSFYREMPDSLSLVDEVTLLPLPNMGGLKILKRGSTSAIAVDEDTIPIDLFFPSFHGTYGEDGCIQGLLELAEVSYTGSGVLASALSMSKQHSKDIVSCYGVPILPSVVISKERVQQNFGQGFIEERQRIIKTPGFEKFPLFVKPCTLGSSIGISRVKDLAELDAAILKAMKYDSAVMIEPCLDKKLEINVSVLEAAESLTSVPEIPISSSGHELSYEDKYLRGGSKKTGDEAQGMAALTRIIDPPDLAPEMKSLAREYALKAFQSLGCRGVARIDFMLDLDTNILYFNEINPIPGSFSFYLWAGTEPPIFFTDLITRIIERAIREHNEKASLSRDFGFKALLKV